MSSANQLIMANNFVSKKEYKKAYEILEAISEREAKWYHVMGIVCFKIGYYEKGEKYITEALSIDPQNEQYKSTIMEFSRYHDDYRDRAHGYHRRRHGMGCCCCDECCCCCGDGGCDTCTKLWCADTLCECMGGDLITCC